MIFRQTPEPGRMALSGFTDAGGLGVMIAGQPLAHRLYRFVLACSGCAHEADRQIQDRDWRFGLD